MDGKGDEITVKTLYAEGLWRGSGVDRDGYRSLHLMCRSYPKATVLRTPNPRPISASVSNSVARTICRRLEGSEMQLRMLGMSLIYTYAGTMFSSE